MDGTETRLAPKLKRLSLSVILLELFFFLRDGAGECSLTVKNSRSLPSPALLLNFEPLSESRFVLPSGRVRRVRSRLICLHFVFRDPGGGRPKFELVSPVMNKII